MGDRWLSPLRYPGGKARMAPFLEQVFAGYWGPMDVEIWMEPFAGGAGAGLTVLQAQMATDVWLVEKNPAIAALWRVIIDDGPWFADAVAKTAPDMRLWGWARETLAARWAGGAVPDRDLGLAAFVTNRCSRSGIVIPNVGPIGGKNQTGRWKVGARFNGPELAQRIRTINALPGRLRIIEGDATEHIGTLTGSGIEDEVFLFVDPPYIREGNRLYASGMDMADHQALAAALISCPSPWLLTYDNEPTVLELYPDNWILEFDIAHTANQARIDHEYMVLADHVGIPDHLKVLPRGGSRWVRGPGTEEVA